MEIKITDNNFETEVKAGSLPVLVDFYADWCGPCKMMAPLVAQLSENPMLTREFNIMSIPTFILFKDGAVVDTLIGAVSKNELEARIKQVLA